MAVTRMGMGDEILAAGQAQRLYEQHGRRTPILIVDKFGTPRWHPIWEGNPAIATPEMARSAGYPSVISGPDARPYFTALTREHGWTFNRAFRCRDHVAKLHLTGPERHRGQYVRTRYGPYVLIEPWSKHQNLRWPLAQWQQLVDGCPDLRFVQHVHAASTECVLRGVHRETATFREACGLAAFARCYLRGESGMCHAVAALGRPQVTIWGGCMVWEVMGGYRHQIGVGVTPPACGQYQPCAHCAAIMAAISVEDVITALRQQLGAGVE